MATSTDGTRRDPSHLWTRIGTRKTGAPIWLIRGGAESDGTSTGSNGTSPTGTADSGGSLLEADADNLDDDDASTNGDATGNGGKGDGNGPQVDVDKLTADVEARLDKRLESLFDRRINAVLKEIRKGQPAADSGKTDQGETPKGAAPAVDPNLPRAARLAYREYVGDEVRFISTEERAHATELANALIGDMARRGQLDDEDQAGRQVAQQVAKQIKGLRAHYEARTTAALRKRGLLREDSRPGQPIPGGSGTGGVTAQTSYERGAQLARDRGAARTPARTGPVDQGAGQRILNAQRTNA